MSPRSKPLFDFGAGLLIGLSITVALFAAMEESEGRLSHDMLLAGLAALLLAIVLKVAARDRPPHGRGRSRPAGRLQETAAGTGWTVERPQAATPGASVSRKDNATARDARAKEALPDLTAAHRDAQAHADGETRRL